MSLGAVLVVLIVSSARADPAGPALEAAARELLGQTASIRVDLTPENLPDPETLERARGADGVVELVWSEDQASAFLHCYVSRDGRWVDRKITFGVADSDAERGRLLGFAIASMFPRLVTAAEEAGPGPRSAEPMVAPRAETRHLPRARPRANGLALELGASATTGVRGPADAIGAGIGLRLPLFRSLSLRLGLGGRLGDIPIAQASTKAASGALGLAWVVSPLESPLELGLRVDSLVTWLEVTRALPRAAEPESRARWMFGGAALVEGGYRFSRAFGLFGGAGVEALLGETDIYAEGQFEAKLPLFRVVGELSLRASF